MVMVYHFKVYNVATDEIVVPPLKSTAERINRIGGEIIQETGVDVPTSSLDGDGRYNPDA